jgi:hypothetical protein
MYVQFANAGGKRPMRSPLYNPAAALAPALRNQKSR